MTKLLKRYLLMIKNKKWTGHLIFIFFIEQRNPADGLVLPDFFAFIYLFS